MEINLLKKFESMIIIVFIAFFIGTTQGNAQTIKKLDELDVELINTLRKSNSIKLESTGWSVDPDVWNYMEYRDRKNFANKLALYFFGYTEQGRKAEGFCHFFNMATKKKLARWYKDDYKEYK